MIRYALLRLLKLNFPERVFLLCHILRMLVEPEDTQHPAIRRAGLNLNILEEHTFESLSTWFGSKEAPKNKGKKSLLVEMFKVARQEARFRSREIGKFDTLYHINPHYETYSI